MKTALLKNTFREIKNTKARFISILLIVALGVGFFVGVKTTSPSMKQMAIDYYNANNLMDFRLVSTVGFDENDVDAVKNTDGIKDVMPSYFLDVAVSSDESGRTIRLMSSPKSYKDNSPISEVIITEGRMPEKSGEIAVEGGNFSAYNLGDKITISQNVGETDISKQLEVFEYTVVGKVKSPLYIAIERGTTTVGNGKIDEFAYISESDFSIEKYTVLYTTVDTKSKQISPFESEYDELIKDVTKNLDKTAYARIEAFVGNNIDKAQKEIDDGYTELENKKAQAKKEFETAQAELDKSESDYYTQIDSAQAQIDNAQVEISTGRQELKNQWKEYESAQKEFETKISEAKEQLADAQAQFDEAYAPVEKMKSSKATLQDNVVRIAVDTLNGIIKYSHNDIDPTILDTLSGYVSTITYDNAKSVLSDAKAVLPNEYKSLYNVTIDAAIAEIDLLNYRIGKLDSSIAEADKQFEPAKAELENSYAQFYEQEQEGLDGLSLFKSELEKAQNELDNASVELENSRIELDKAKTDGLQKLEDGKEELDKQKKKAKKEFSQAEKKLTKAQKELDEFGEVKWFVFNRDDNPGYSGFIDNTNRVDAVASVFPLFFLLVAMLVCLTTMTRLVEEKRTEIGTLKALGYSNISIVLKFVSYACLAALFGCVLGCLTCIPTLPQVIYEAYGMLYNMRDSVEIVVDKVSLIVAIVAAFACCALVTFFVCYKSLRDKPASLMRPKAPKAGKRILLERITPLWKRLKFSSKVMYRNIFRYKSRLFMTVVGIAGCTALMLSAFGLYDAINDIVALQFEDLCRYNTVIVSDKEKSVDEMEPLVQAVSDDSRLKYSALLSQKAVSTSHNDNTVSSEVYLMVANEPSDLQKLITLRTRETGEKLTLSDKGVVITEKLANMLDVTVGDEIEIGEEGDTAKIIGIAENYVYNYIYMSEQAYTEMSGEKPLYSTIFAYAENIDTELEKELGTDYLKRDDTTAITFTTTIINDFKDMINSLNIVVLVMIISAGALAFVVLYNLTNINLAERNREIATIKVLGFTHKETSNYVYRENIILTVLGIAVGLVLGVFLCNFIVTTIEIDTVMFGKQIHAMSYVLAFALTALFALLVNFIMHFRIKAINMVESLKSIE